MTKRPPTESKRRSLLHRLTNHKNNGNTTWMAGGGAKGGFSDGANENGDEAIEGRMHIHDWHATILHLMGLDHTRLTHRCAGRDFRLTDVHGTVAKEIMAGSGVTAWRNTSAASQETMNC